ncbi:MAG: hypothetical protein ACHQF3_10940 [Alphaproteobacteria bacterium]
MTSKAAEPATESSAPATEAPAVDVQRFDQTDSVTIRNDDGTRVKLKLRVARAKAPHFAFVVSGVDPFLGKAIGNILPRLSEIIATKRRELTRREIEELAALFMPDDSMRGVTREIELDNIRLRRKFLTAWQCLTSPEVHARSGAGGENRYVIASRWKRAGRVFSVKVGRHEVFPAFQFDDDGEPKPAIERALKALAGKLSSWQTALWFVSPNSWLDGAKPVEKIDDAGAIEAAAKFEVEEVLY